MRNPYKVNMVYFIARKMGKTVTYTKAKEIAARYSILDLDKIYRLVAKR